MVMLSKAELQNVEFYRAYDERIFYPIKIVLIFSCSRFFAFLYLHEICDILQLWGKAPA